MTNFTDIIFQKIIECKALIIKAWIWLYIILLGVFVTGGYFIYINDEKSLFFYQLAILLGKLAALHFVITVIPGIAGRFNIRHKLIAILRIFRRYLGIMAFLLAFIHASFVRLIPIMLKYLPLYPRPAFELFGAAALILTLPLFLTSNDTSVRLLGPWWYHIHKLIYIILWLIFLHVFLQRISFWSVLIGITTIVEACSLIHRYVRSVKNKLL